MTGSINIHSMNDVYLLVDRLHKQFKNTLRRAYCKVSNTTLELEVQTLVTGCICKTIRAKVTMTTIITYMLSFHSRIKILAVSVTIDCWIKPPASVILKALYSYHYSVPAYPPF